MKKLKDNWEYLLMIVVVIITLVTLPFNLDGLDNDTIHNYVLLASCLITFQLTLMGIAIYKQYKKNN